MGIVGIAQLKIGMVLADDVRDVNGRLLLAKGEEIQTQHVRILKTWGIAEVKISGEAEPEDSASAPIDAEKLEKEQADTEFIFSHIDRNHPAVKILYDLCVLYRCHHNGNVADVDLRAAPPDSSTIEKIRQDVIERIRQNEIKLPEIPVIVSELNEVIANPYTSAKHIAEVVYKSPSLTTLLLKIVNSPLYGFPQKIDRVSHAVTLIGTQEISSLALGITILSVFKDLPEDIIDMRSFLKHSLACGIIARILAAQKNWPQTEQLFVSGLLHDIGRLILYVYFQSQARNLLAHAIKSNTILYQEEKNILGCQHTDIAKYLLKKWQIPSNIENNVSYHHHPSNAKNPEQAAVVHTADIIVNGLGIGTSGERFVPPLDNDAWNRLGLSPSCFETAIQLATHQLSSLDLFLENLQPT